MIFPLENIFVLPVYRSTASKFLEITQIEDLQLMTAEHVYMRNIYCCVYETEQDVADSASLLYGISVSDLL